MREGPVTLSGVDLMGPGWGRWKASWRSRRRLVCRGGQWRLEEGSSCFGQWAGLREAVETLWPERRERGRLPWAVGWIGYEEAARLAGDLPCREEEDGGPPRAFLLLEPETCEPTTSVRGGSMSRDCSLHWSLDGADYRSGVESIREEIAAGSVYQVNLCRRLTVDGWTGGLGKFLEEAVVGRTPDYLAYVDFGSGELLCASMEMLLQRRGQCLETRPIKGTRPRGTTAAEDQQMADDLFRDPKERSELAMIVDLERNDLGKVAETGSVKVGDPGSIESYASVHHLVARVTGTARRELQWWDILAAVIPGGSVTGCPKVAAMSVIKKLEPAPRGPFTGAFGVIAGDGDLEMALPIRTAWRVGRTLEFAAGCGIVWQSRPSSEERESRLKVERWLKLVGSE